MTFKTSSSHEEGAVREWQILTKNFQGDENNVVSKTNLIKLEPNE